jgi:hypothetical protein
MKKTSGQKPARKRNPKYIAKRELKFTESDRNIIREGAIRRITLPAPSSSAQTITIKNYGEDITVGECVVLKHGESKTFFVAEHHLPVKR